MHIVYLLLGGNIGDRTQMLQSAAAQLSMRVGTIVANSALYETAAWGKEAQPKFLNSVLAIATTLSAEELLTKIQTIENLAGRQREEVWGARTLDIDILFYDHDIIQTADLTIPHPFIQDRRFVLTPLCEIAPDLVHPVLHKTITELLAHCPDTLEVTKIR